MQYRVLQVDTSDHLRVEMETDLLVYINRLADKLEGHAPYLQNKFLKQIADCGDIVVARTVKRELLRRQLYPQRNTGPDSIDRLSRLPRRDRG